jgi:hypothetical protein
MITYKNDFGELHELTVSEFKEKLEKLEKEGYGDYIVHVGYDANHGYESVGNDEPSIHHDEKQVFFDTDITF